MSQSLYKLEEGLQALLDSEDLISPEQQEEYRRDLQQSMVAAVEKRERVGHFLLHVQRQRENIAAEIDRLHALDAHYASKEKFMSRLVADAITTFTEPDKNGKYRPLEGKTIRLSVQQNPQSVEIVNEAAIPAQYVTVTTQTTVSKKEISKALKADIEVPGARLKDGDYRLVVK